MARLNPSGWALVFVAAALWAVTTPACSCADLKEPAVESSPSEAKLPRAEADSSEANPVAESDTPRDDPRDYREVDKTETLIETPPTNVSNSDGNRSAHGGNVTSSKSMPNAIDAGHAVQSARGMAKSAANSAASGDYSSAFLESRDAWAMVAQFPTDVKCKSLSLELLDLMRKYSIEANETQGATSEGKILILK